MNGPLTGNTTTMRTGTTIAPRAGSTGAGRAARALAAALACVAALAPPLAAGDDTEVFFARPAANGSRDANVMFMFDISGSMSRTDGTPYTRITRLKQAVLELLDRAEGVNIGIGAFNGGLQGGSVHYPATDLDEDVCPNGSCGTIRVAVPVREPADDAEQMPGGEVHLYQGTLDLVQPEPSGVQARSYALGSGADDAVELPTGTVELDGAELSFFHAAGRTGATEVGVRFPNVDIPKDARVLEARIRFRARANAARGVQAAEIRIDEQKDPPAFGAVPGLGVSHRDPASSVVEWPDIPGRSGGSAVDTPDLSALVEERVSDGDWDPGHALAFLFEIGGSEITGASFRRGFESFESGAPPTLEVRYTTDAPKTNTVGLRFAGLEVPRGAKITDASLELTSLRSDSAKTELEVRAEKTGDAAPFLAVPNDLGDRDRTSHETWKVAPWAESDEQYRSSDLSKVVQKIVDRDDWCGGNALALLIEGEGLRLAESRDRGPWSAPVLRVGYEASSVDFSDTCLSRTTIVRVDSGADDATEALDTGAVELDEAVLSTGDPTGERLIALRFDSLELPAGAMIGRAHLALTSAGATAGDASIEIRGEVSGYAEPFVPGTGSDIGRRPLSSSAATWRRVEGTHAGDRLESSDLGAVLRDVTSAPGWESGDPVVLVLRRAGGSGRRLFESVDGDPGAAPALAVSYRLTGDELDGEAVPLRTARDEIRDRVLEFRAQSGTPLVDAYYEGASYMLGRPVRWGLSRGYGTSYERSYRVSHADSYVGGIVQRPPECTEIDPNSAACAAERIADDPDEPGEPTYIAPVAGACQVNQLVLLTDGAATANSSKALIRDLVGAGECATRPNGAAECAIELAEWMHAPPATAGVERVLTHTVGFNLAGDTRSTDFLRDLASAGGGGFHEASSAGQLASVFNTIVDEAAEIDTGFTAAAATVDRFNRTANREDVYYAMFRPETSARWAGNLKSYRLGTDAGTGEQTVVDRLSRSIFGADGGVSTSASSFWGTGTDGADVSLGGAANAFTSPREVKTFLYDAAGTPGTLVDLAETTVELTAAELGVTGADPAYVESLLKWSRGIDVLDADGDGDRTELRREMGDPMHSTPFVLDYGLAPTTSSTVFVATNEGYLHAIDTASGAELWSIVPGDLLANLHRFFDDEPGLDRPYGLDGEIVGWVEDANGNLAVDGTEKAYVVVGMRRGGRNYYAFDVTDRSSPSLAWVVRGGSGDFAKLGQSWSAPVKTRLVVDGTATDVLIFGGGYETAHDTLEERTETGTGIGQALYVVNAATGARIAELDATDFSDLDHAIPSDLNVIDVDLDGFADTVFVGDMGGQLWRFDFDHGATTGRIDGIGVTGGVIADLNGGARLGNRRFYHPPDVALMREGGASFLTVAIGSGWRAHPLDTEVQDRFYVLRDAAVYGPPRDELGDVAYEELGESDLFDATDATTASDTAGRSAAGWFVDLERDGEKVLGRSLTLNGQVFFTSYVPDAENVDECSVSVGGGRLYAMDVLTAAPVLDLDDPDADPDTDAGLALADRSGALDTPGIPAPVSVLTGADGGSSVFTKDGREDDVDFGEALRPTYWAEQ